MKALLLPSLVLVLLASRATAQDKPSLDDTIAALAKLNKPVLAADGPERKLRAAALREWRDDANARDREAWATITSKAAWKKYRDAKLELLRRSLGRFPEPPKQVKVLTTKTIDGDGFRIENLVYESRPGLVVTANMYVPKSATPQAGMPGIVVIHSHHNPKTQGELQDMGMTWARAGCLVLVPDMLGHGERRQHPFNTAKDYRTPFKVGRQDYYFRYNLGVQLQLAGESLIGWMAWDLMRGIDVLLERPGIDKNKIIVLGSVAGGGDPAAVLAALDRRVAAVVPFNFGGAQPETKFPLPADAEQTFNYMGGGSWESTRNLRNSARDGFLPWLIVAAAAPRPLIYAHEFAWDRAHDPVWKRLQKIYGFYGATDKLAAVNGRGSVRGKPPEATHCNNIGAEQRKGIHAAFERWFGIKAREYSKRVPAAELQCLTAEARERFKPRPVWELVREMAEKRLAQARADRVDLLPQERHDVLERECRKLLGCNSKLALYLPADIREEKRLSGFHYKTICISGGGPYDMRIPALWLMPLNATKRTPVVIGLAQQGKAGFLQHRSEVIARLLRSGVSVCLPDLCGTGETRQAISGRGRTSGDTGISATLWMHGQTRLGWQLMELSLVMGALGEDSRPFVLWGDAFADTNGMATRLAVPYDGEPFPRLGDSTGPLVALFGSLNNSGKEPDGDVRGILIRGGLASYRSALADAFFYLPHDALVPGVLTECDIDDVAAAWAPRALRIEAAIDAHNRRLNRKQLDAAFALTRAAYAGKAGLELRAEASSAAETARWLVHAATGAGR